MTLISSYAFLVGRSNVGHYKSLVYINATTDFVETALTERISHKRDCLYKDKITCLKPQLFVLEKAYYTYKNTVIRQAGRSIHLLVICSISDSL